MTDSSEKPRNSSDKIHDGENLEESIKKQRETCKRIESELEELRNADHQISELKWDRKLLRRSAQIIQLEIHRRLQKRCRLSDKIDNAEKESSVIQEQIPDLSLKLDFFESVKFMDNSLQYLKEQLNLPEINESYSDHDSNDDSKYSIESASELHDEYADEVRLYSYIFPDMCSYQNSSDYFDKYNSISEEWRSLKEREKDIEESLSYWRRELKEEQVQIKRMNEDIKLTGMMLKGLQEKLDPAIQRYGDDEIRVKKLSVLRESFKGELIRLGRLIGNEKI